MKIYEILLTGHVYVTARTEDEAIELAKGITKDARLDLLVVNSQEDPAEESV